MFLIAHRASYGMKYSVESEKKYISLEGRALWAKPVNVLCSYKLLKDHLPLESQEGKQESSEIERVGSGSTNSN